jgi:hypothetical protein
MFVDHWSRTVQTSLASWHHKCHILDLVQQSDAHGVCDNCLIHVLLLPPPALLPPLPLLLLLLLLCFPSPPPLETLAVLPLSHLIGLRGTISLLLRQCFLDQLAAAAAAAALNLPPPPN